MNALLPIIVCIDPGTRCGWAILEPSSDGEYTLIRFGEFRTNVHRVQSILEYAKLLASGRCVSLAIETQYMRSKRGKLGPKSVMGLVMNRARWQVIAELYGFTVVEVSPLKWQSAMLKATRNHSSEVRKSRSKSLVRSFFSFDSIGEHEADAICIGMNECRIALSKVNRESKLRKGER